MEEYRAWNKNDRECAIEIETVDSDPVRFRIVWNTPGMTELLQPWTDVETLGIVLDEWTMLALADEIIERYDLIREDRHGADFLAQRVAELASLGLSANEAAVYAKVEVGLAVTAIAKQQGVSEQRVSDELRRAKIKVTGFNLAPPRRS
jgi:hypothetical protein